MLLLRAEAVGTGSELWWCGCARPLILPSSPAQACRLGSDDSPLGVFGLVDGIEQFAASAPAVRVVIADDIVFEGSKELGRSGTVGCYLVVAAGHQPGVVEAMADGYHLGSGARSLGRVLVAYLIANAPHHHRHAETVAQVQELRCRRIVSGADGIAAATLQYLQPTLPHPLRNGSPYCPAIMVQVDALHLHLPAIEQEALVEGIFDGADA